ncbi:hypothetical protein EJ08DRAFT_245899 [Tothia fuscella]|uniref:F-box domain-containing protein n=1 Tax=Tothia fuscella TaxID=1048955 RepID=A0A9P4TYE3_9PEZI|nr:hypothetical protein EJ08DRAFT_245899 [Tothia fuscella]
MRSLRPLLHLRCGFPSRTHILLSFTQMIRSTDDNTNSVALPSNPSSSNIEYASASTTSNSALSSSNSANNEAVPAALLNEDSSAQSTSVVPDTTPSSKVRCGPIRKCPYVKIICRSMQDGVTPPPAVRTSALLRLPYELRYEILKHLIVPPGGRIVFSPVFTQRAWPNHLYLRRVCSQLRDEIDDLLYMDTPFIAYMYE